MAQGHTGIELVDRNWCSGCAAGEGTASMAHETVATVAALLEALGLPATFSPRFVHRPLPVRLARPLVSAQDRAPPARRAFFGALLHRSAAPPKPPAGGVTRGACQPSPVIRHHRRAFADLLAKLAQRAGRGLSAAFFPTLAIDSACTHHGICAAVCPSGALSTFEAPDGTVGLVFDAQQCIACGLCARHCPDGAIRVSPFGNSEDPHPRHARPLVRHHRKTCTQCGGRFVDMGASSTCPDCQKARGMAIDLFGTVHART
ncbi:MAG: 4Fe-4S dicluster domain-containing protein [Rhodoferax sp.]